MPVKSSCTLCCDSFLQFTSTEFTELHIQDSSDPSLRRALATVKTCAWTLNGFCNEPMNICEQTLLSKWILQLHFCLTCCWWALTILSVWLSFVWTGKAVCVRPSAAAQHHPGAGVQPVRQADRQRYAALSKTIQAYVRTHYKASVRLTDVPPQTRHYTNTWNKRTLYWTCSCRMFTTTAECFQWRAWRHWLGSWFIQSGPGIDKKSLPL